MNTSPPSYLNIHFVFAVDISGDLLDESWEIGMFNSITSALGKIRQRVLAINGMPDHMHVLVGMNPNNSVAVIEEVIRSVSAAFVNDNELAVLPFKWQEGYCAFSFGYFEVDEMIKYINDQKELHEKVSFKTEYIAMLKAQDIDFDEKDLFTFMS